MKRIAFLFLVLALVLTACAAPTPVTIIITAVPPTTEPVMATDVPAPTDKPAPTDEPVVAPTDTLEPAAPTDTPKPGVAPTNTQRSAVSVFTDITRDVDAFSLRCNPVQLNFSITSINPAITGVIIYYRVYDKNLTLDPPIMIAGPNMVGDKKGHFTLEFKATDVKDDMRIANGWFEYQFVGLNKSGNVVGRTEKIVKQVTFTLDCP